MRRTPPIDIRSFEALESAAPSVNAAAIETALHAAAANGGGTVVVPPGTWNTGTTGLFDGVNGMEALGRYRRNLSAGDGGYSDAHTTVGSYLPNAWGLYDMHGNVWELCLDWYQSRGSFPSVAVNDPTGPTAPSYSDPVRPRWPPGRVLRGGSWDNDEERCRSAARGTFTSTSGESCGRNIGFRLCCAGEQ